MFTMEKPADLEDDVICGKILLLKKEWEISFICNFCEKTLATLPNLLRHALSVHVAEAAADKLEKLCGVETKQELDVEPVVEHQEQEEMDEEILRHFMNNAAENDEEHVKCEIASTPVEINDDVSEAPSNAKFEFLDVDETIDDSTKLEPTAVLPKRACKISTMLQCEICNAKFHTDLQFRLHKKNVHGEKPFPCTQCGKGFSEKRCLSIHEMRHKGIKPHACTTCEKTFTTRTECLMHMLRHTGERTYKCPVCDKTFKASTDLCLHQRIHREERAYLCPTCGKSFYSTTALQNHKSTHSSERPHKCSQCSASFKNRGGLRQHLHLHSEVKKFNCQFCGKLFAQKAGVTSHIKSVHKHEQKVVNQ